MLWSRIKLSKYLFEHPLTLTVCIVRNTNRFLLVLVFNLQNGWLCGCVIAPLLFFSLHFIRAWKTMVQSYKDKGPLSSLLDQFELEDMQCVIVMPHRLVVQHMSFLSFWPFHYDCSKLNKKANHPLRIRISLNKKKGSWTSDKNNGT